MVLFYLDNSNTPEALLRLGIWPSKLDSNKYLSVDVS